MTNVINFPQHKYKKASTQNKVTKNNKRRFLFISGSGQS